MKRAVVGAAFVISAVCAAALLFALSPQHWDNVSEKISNLTGGTKIAEPNQNKLPTVVKPGASTFTETRTPTGVRVVPGAGTQADIIAPTRIQVIDGDTIRVDGKTFRLVGFDTPEMGDKAKCASERSLAKRASDRLRQIVSGGNLRFERIACSCQPGTEGTQRCNYGRFCGTLTASGRDVGQILIGEGLARRYVCGETKCPPRQSWC